jgi:two-component system NarL family sensor kinase
MQKGFNQLTLFIIVATCLIFLLASFIVTLLFIYQKRQISYNKNLINLKVNFEKSLLTSQIEIQEQTFLNISREIHDNISLSLTLAKLNLNTLDWFDLETAYQSVKSSGHILGLAINDLSNLSKSMNSQLIGNIGLLKALNNEVYRVKTLAHLNIKYDVNGDPIFMNSEKELIVFRIIQEAFNNILKHAQAKMVWLNLEYAEKSLNIMVKDDGIGFSTEEVIGNKDGNHAGLHNMRTRASLFGGEISLDSAPMKGTQILITVPYN